MTRWMVLAAAGMLVCAGASASTLSGDLYSLGDTDSDGLYNYLFEFSVTNSTPDLNLEEVVLYLLNDAMSEVTVGAAPADWVDWVTFDPMPGAGIGALDLAGSADLWTGDSAGYNPVLPMSAMGGFAVGYEFPLLDTWAPSDYLAEFWFTGLDESECDCAGGMDIVFHRHVEEPIIPEPGTLTLLGMGLASAAVWRRRGRAA